MDNQIFENEQQTFNILEYIKENLFGLFLLTLTFFIIYFVDYINGLNALIYSTPSPLISGIASPLIAGVASPPKRKFKKRI
jgi:hypothetical protein